MSVIIKIFYGMVGIIIEVKVSIVAKDSKKFSKLTLFAM